MSKLDPRLRFLQQQEEEDLFELESMRRFAVEAEAVPVPLVKVFVQFTGSLADIQARGFVPRTVSGDIATGTVGLHQLDSVQALENVVRLESSRPMVSELNNSLPDIRADVVHTGPPGHRGAGVIVGIIDTGIDYLHECFRHADGTSRILAIWDQWLQPVGAEANPAGFSYGVEYTKADIDAAIASDNPGSVVRHKDRDRAAGHGTHVAGIAAGDGSVAGNGQPAFTFVGVAPEADIIVVANQAETEVFGDSANALDAVSYILALAGALGRPVVINMSLGDNLGPHDGTSPLEQGIGNLLGGQGQAMVKSAGNEGNKNRHASGTLSQGGTETVRFEVPADDTDPDTIDIWYDGGDLFSMSVTAPDGNATSTIGPDDTKNESLPNGNRVFVDSVVDDPSNHDNRIYIQLSRGTAEAIEQGTWTLALTGDTVVSGRFDAWIERGSRAPKFASPHADSAMTLSVPGTSDELIVVGSYVTMGAEIGSISAFSSRGPTRDRRAGPTLTAPGQSIRSARALDILSGNGPYHLQLGTSMSAPHVTGAIALMLQHNETLTQAEIKSCLMDNCRSDASTGAVPNHTWGHGKLDAKAAFDCAAS